MSALAATRKRPGSMSTMRLRKVHCSSCGYTLRMSRSWIEVGLPACPNRECACHGQLLTCADPADAVEAGLLSLNDLPRTVRTEICRRNGWEQEIIRTSPGRRSKPRQCSHHGCGSFVRKGETLCFEHSGDLMPF